jgi:hypothetical protein
MKPIQALYGVTARGGVPQATLELVHLRASQLNGGSRPARGAEAPEILTTTELLQGWVLVSHWA